VIANRYVPTQGWAGAEVLVANIDDIQNAVAGIDDSGNCLVVWAQGPSIQSRTYKVGVGWEPIVQVSSSPTSRWFYDVKMAVAPDGAAMVVWCEDNMEAYGPFHAAYKPAGGSWQKPSAFQSTSSYVMYVKLTNDGSGNFLTVFTLYDGIEWGVWANSFAPASGWGKEERIENQAYDVGDLNVAMNRAGDTVAVWTQALGYPWNSATAFANYYSPGQGWGTEVPIEELGSGGCDPPVVSIDETGNAVAIWRRVANDLMSSCLRTNTFTAGVGWGTPATLVYSSDSNGESVSVGIVGGETFAAWMHVVFINDTLDGHELVANHYNATSGWEAPAVISTDIASSPSLTADNLGGASIAWFGNATTPNTFVSQYIASTTPPPPPTTHEITKGAQGPRANAVTWEYAPSDYGTWIGRIVNNGLRSLLVDVYDVTTGVPEEIMHQRIRFAANDAYPYGVVNTSGVEMSPAHRYMITVTPGGPRGSSCVVEDTLESPGMPPVAHFSVTVFGYNVQVNASGSYDADGTIVSYRWDWGDGTTGEGWTAMHTYVPGNYTLTLTVTDDDGLTGSASRLVVWGGPPGPPEADYVLTIHESDIYTVHADGSTSHSPNGMIVSYEWDFGDGSTATGMTADHTYSSIGLFQITLKVTDNIGLQDTAAFWVHIYPVFVRFNITVTDYTVTVDASFIDPNGMIASYGWDWGDGATGSSATATHTYPVAGTYLITLVTTDYYGNTEQASQYATVPNPLA
jgi:PKD repeat protein